MLRTVFTKRATESKDFLADLPKSELEKYNQRLGEWGKAPGAIAHAWAWPRALDAAEVAELHAATSRCYPKS